MPQLVASKGVAEVLDVVGHPPIGRSLLRLVLGLSLVVQDLHGRGGEELLAWHRVLGEMVPLLELGNSPLVGLSVVAIVFP